MEIIFELSLLKLGESPSLPFVAHVPHLDARSVAQWLSGSVFSSLLSIPCRSRSRPSSSSSSTSPKIDSHLVRQEITSSFFFADLILLIQGAKFAFKTVHTGVG